MAVISPPVPLQSFQALQHVQITFSGNSVMQQRENINTVLHLLPSTLTNLILEDLADIDMRTLSTIGRTFGNLSSLELSCTERLDDSCCWACLEESASLVWHSPIPDMFRDVEHFTVRPYFVLKGVNRFDIAVTGWGKARSPTFEQIATSISGYIPFS